MGSALLPHGLGEIAALPIGDGQEHRHHQGGEQLQIGGLQAQTEHHGDDHIVDDRADHRGEQLEGEVAEHLVQQHLADDDCRQADDNCAAAHVDGGAALILGQQAAGQGHQPVGHHQAQDLGGVGVDALGPGHALVGAGGPQGGALLRTEEPVQQRDHRRRQQHQQQQRVVQRRLPHVAGGQEQVVLVHTHRQGGLGGSIFIPDGHDAQVDGVEGQLGQNTRQDGGDAAGGMQHTGGQPGQHTRQHRRQHCQPGVPAHADAQGRHRAAGSQGAVHRQIGHIQYFIGDIDADGHNAPDQPLPRGAGQGVEQAYQNIHLSSCLPLESGLQTGTCQKAAGNGGPFPRFSDVCASLNGLIAVGHRDAQHLTVRGVVHLGHGRVVLDCHLGHVRLAGEDLDSHLTGDTAQLLIADGEGGHAAAGADARLAAYHGHPGGDDYIGDGFGVVGRRVVGGDIDHIGAITGGLGHGGEVVHVGEGVLGTGVAHLLQIALDGLHLKHGVGLGGAVEQAHVLRVGEQLLEHGGLLVQRGQVGGAGDVAAQYLVLCAVQAQGDAVVGDGGAQNGDVGGGGLGCLERIGGVGQHQVHIFRHKAVHDGGAVVVLAAGVLLVKLHPILAEGLHQSRLEAPGGRVQRVVGGELADTHQIGLPPEPPAGDSFGSPFPPQAVRPTAITPLRAKAASFLPFIIEFLQSLPLFSNFNS